MGENSKIEWTDHTMNFWVGCTKVSPACDYCYAESWAKRAGNPELWTGERRRTTRENWLQPYKWNDRARPGARPAWDNHRPRIFTNSLADFFDNQVPAEWRADAWHVIDKTRHLDWLILTKWPQNIAKMLPFKWGDGWSHVWLGTTCENQEVADRNIPILLSVPAAVRFVSLEPLLGPIHLWWFNGPGARIDWVICGGESGHHARPMRIEWVRNLRDQCAAAGVPFHFKQWGEHRPDDPAANRTAMVRVGKRAAGRLLDGIEHNGLPS